MRLGDTGAGFPMLFKGVWVHCGQCFKIQAGFALLRDHSGKLLDCRRKPDRKDVIMNPRDAGLNTYSMDFP